MTLLHFTARSVLARTALACTLAGALTLTTATADAQSYPSRPVKVVVPFATGAASDIITRLVFDRVAAAMGQGFVVENRPGAGGTVGSDFVSKAAPDGYTLLISTAALPISAGTYKNLRYDSGAFTPITVMTHSPLGFAANLNFPPKTIKEFIDYAKANPGKVNFGSLGIATSHHLTGEKFKLDTGIDMVHVPYKGSSAAHTDLIGGQIQVMFDNLVALLPQIKAGKVRALAVSSAKRHPLLPEVPSIAEGGVRDFEAVAWFGVVAPPGTPRDIAARLNSEIVKVLNAPDMKQRLTDGGSLVIANTPDEAGAFLKNEISRWGVVVKAANITAE